ncbi:hypothetical protein IMZ48_32845 [Candidatus Bathyarchaeota archaeon]|nr:hypothetical protein [Candidatus Bathyarchaeota archaeon]
MASEDELQPWIDDALKQIEFVCGPADSEWGAKRAELGYEEPFPLHYVEVGNEDWLGGGEEGWAAYQEYRLPMFMEAILAVYPEMNIISSGSTYDVGGFDIPEPAIGDYHPYREPDQFLEEFNLFDNNTTPHVIGTSSILRRYIVGDAANSHTLNRRGFLYSLQRGSWLRWTPSPLALVGRVCRRRHWPDRLRAQRGPHPRHLLRECSSTSLNLASHTLTKLPYRLRFCATLIGRSGTLPWSSTQLTPHSLPSPPTGTSGRYVEPTFCSLSHAPRTDSFSSTPPTPSSRPSPYPASSTPCSSWLERRSKTPSSGRAPATTPPTTPTCP